MNQSNLQQHSSSTTQESYKQIDEKLRVFLFQKGYDVLQLTGNESHGTFTYHVEKEGMPYWVKMGYGQVENRTSNFEIPASRILEIKNEVAVLSALWNEFPYGETETFQIPPGPEEVFDTRIDGVAIYGYARFLVEGKVLASSLLSGDEGISKWSGTLIAILQNIVNLPDLSLPLSTAAKSVDFNKIFKAEAEKLYEEYEKRFSGEGSLSEEFSKMARKCLEKAIAFIDTKPLVLGTVHGNFQPEHIVYLEEHGLPTLVQFSQMSQAYPKYYDLSVLYTWIALQLRKTQDAKSIIEVFSKEQGFSKDDSDHVKHLTNIAFAESAMLSMVGAGEIGEGKLDADSFLH